jgi:hypothetical protein
MRKERRWKLVALLATGMAIGVVMVGTPAGAHVGGTVNHVWNHLKPKADARYVNEGELLWAVVDGTTGTLARGNRVTSVSKSGTGLYQVRFGRNVRNCAYAPTIRLTGASLTSPPGAFTVVGEAASVNGTFLTTHDSAGAAADRSFHLIVDCGRTSAPGRVVVPSSGSGSLDNQG